MASLRQAWQQERCFPLASSATAAELMRVLTYPKFKLTSAEIRGLIEEALLPFIETVRTSPSIIPKLRDPDDTKFITCAVTAGVRWLVSGDDDLLSLHRIKSVEIVSVTAFLQHLKRKP